MLTNEITEATIGAAITVHRELGPGLFESAYRTCLARELTRCGLRYRREVAVPVVYRGERLNLNYRMDLLVEETVVVEVKAVEALNPVHKAQVITYLKLADKPVGLLINFNVVLLKQGIKRLARDVSGVPLRAAR